VQLIRIVSPGPRACKRGARKAEKANLRSGGTGGVKPADVGLEP
jgi:hypothetical protein